MGTLIKAGLDSALPQALAQEHLKLSCELVKLFALDVDGILDSSYDPLYGEPDDAKMRFKSPIKVYGCLQDLDWSWESTEPGLKGEKLGVCFFAKKDFSDNSYDAPKQGDIIEGINVRYIILKVSKSASRFGQTEDFSLYECSLKRDTKYRPEDLQK